MLTTIQAIFPTLVVLAVVAVPLLVWALIGDRSRGRRRCPICWYAMDGSGDRPCPECGHRIRHVRELRRSRRRWRWAAVAAVPITAFVAVLLVGTLAADEPHELLPATAAIAWLYAADSEMALDRTE